MELLEVRKQNDGHTPPPSFVRGDQIPKQVLSFAENDRRFLLTDNYYCPQDLNIAQLLMFLEDKFSYMNVIHSRKNGILIISIILKSK